MGNCVDFAECRDLLQRRLGEQAPGRVQLLTGPRQVGKTTLLLELAAELGDVAIYAAADAPKATLPGSWSGSGSRPRKEQSGEGVRSSCSMKPP
jgi:hypothetical protein